MANISAGMIKELREKTGAGMLDCKNALNEASGEMEKAVEILRKKGVASAAKKASRIASEGLVQIHMDQSRAAIVEVNCETDFVGKNEEFQSFLKTLAEHIHQERPGDLKELLDQVSKSHEKSWENVTQELVAKIGENISIRRFQDVQAGPGELLGSYIHMGGKIGTLVRVKGDAAKISETLLKDLAMHVAAAAPRFLNRTQIPDEVKEKEREIFRAQMQDSGKPPEILEKIIEGKINKFASEVSLVDQVFVKDPQGKKTIAQVVKAVDPEAEVTEFIRFQVGEGLEKKQEDFAAEVAKQISQ